MHSQKPLFQENSQNILLFVFILTAGICLLAFAAVSSAQQSPSNTVTVVNGNMQSANVASTPEPPKSIVRGRVVYEDTGRPVRRSPFSLLNIKGGIGKSGLTDDNGDFALKDVAEGRYFIAVNAPGVLNVLSYIDFSAKSDDESKENTLAEAGKNFEEIVVTPGSETQIFARAKHGGAIGGRVYYADGAPAIGVKVEVLRKTNDKFMGVLSNFADTSPYMRDMPGVKTDDRGVYRASGLPPGEYIIKVSERASHNENSDSDSSPFGVSIGAMSLLSTYYPDANNAEMATVVSLEIGQEAAEVNITLPERAFFTVAGKVIAKGTQNPVKGAKISIKRKEEVFTLSDRMSEERGFSADEQGAWSFKDLPAGNYVLKIKPSASTSYEEHNENGNLKPNRKPKPKFAPTEKEITITDKNLIDVKIEMPFGGSISGFITEEGGRPLPDSLQIQAFNDTDKTFDTTRVRNYDYKTYKPLANPEFNLENLSTGNFYLNFTASNNRRGQTGKDEPIYYLKGIKLGAKDYLTTPFEVGEGSNIEKVQIVLGSDGGRLEGKVKEKDDQPAIAKRIVLIPTDESKWRSISLRLTGVSNSNGEFEAAGAPVEYFVFFLTTKDKLIEINAAWIREHSSGAEKVIIKPKETTTANLTAP